MGMDLRGLAPTSEAGKAFRANVWFWHPLWTLCCDLAPELIDDELAQRGHLNDGTGLDAEGAIALGKKLILEQSFGGLTDHEERFYAQQKTLEMERCEQCKGTGIRDDGVGRRYGYDTRELGAEMAAETGRTHGWCNGCGGRGKRPPLAARYRFSADFALAFAEFLASCGGFEIG